jgi:Na+-translocating ferredoxin:NAD+ oxidoreductase subunit C
MRDTETKHSQGKKIWDIPGGIHPPENKQQSLQLPLGNMPLASEFIYPLNQHMGAPAKPIVAVGDKVLAGEKIAQGNGIFSAPIHASTSGTVIAIEKRPLPHPSGLEGESIVLASDGKHQWIELQGCEHYKQLAHLELVEKVREAGIVGLGGAGFPTAVKLNPKASYSIHTLIMNGAECEPYITADDMLMQMRADEVVAGTELLAIILGKPKNIIIGIEDNKPKAIETIIKAAAAYKSIADIPIQVVSFPTKYPSGGEKQLIQILTGQEVPSGDIPASIGVVVQNVGTAVAAYRAVRFGEPLVSRITTLVGKALTTQRNVEVPLGTPVSYLLEQHGFDNSNNQRLIMGGPMMGFTLATDAVPVVKTTNCIIAPNIQELPEPAPEQPCIRCGFCTQACPASLLPQQLYWYTRNEDYDRAENYHLFDCIECGACAYVCPSNIPLVQYYRAAKGAIRKKQQEKIKADLSRQRFEFRKQRLAMEEAEKTAKRIARTQAAETAKETQQETLPSTEGFQTSPNGRQASSTRHPQNQAVAIGKVDPVTEAIIRAHAQNENTYFQQDRLQRMASQAEDRVKKLQAKLDAAVDNQKDKLTSQLCEARNRLNETLKKLSKHTPS